MVHRIWHVVYVMWYWYLRCYMIYGILSGDVVGMVQYMSMDWVLLAAVVEQSRAPVHLEGARKNGSSECWEQGAPESRVTRPQAKNHLKKRPGKNPTNLSCNLHCLLQQMHHTGSNSFCVLSGDNGSEYSTSAVAIRVLTLFGNRRDQVLRKNRKAVEQFEQLRIAPRQEQFGMAGLWLKTGPIVTKHPPWPQRSRL